VPDIALFLKAQAIARQLKPREPSLRAVQAQRLKQIAGYCSKTMPALI
jgi:hypothetical protein